jgi:hypothetical protein
MFFFVLSYIFISTAPNMNDSEIYTRLRQGGTMQTNSVLTSSGVSSEPLSVAIILSSPRHRSSCPWEILKNNDWLDMYERILCVQREMWYCKHSHMKCSSLSYIHQNFNVSYSLCLFSLVFEMPWYTFGASERYFDHDCAIDRAWKCFAIVGFALNKIMNESLTITDW